MAFAGARFANAVLAAAQGATSDLPEYSYIDLTADEAGGRAIQDVVGHVPFFSVPITLGPNGVEKIHALGELSSYERQLVSQAVEGLQGNIAKGVSFQPTKL